MRVNEIFYSLQGEGRWTGTASVFVRLSGCNLKCWFCDTKHEEGTEMSEEEILERVSSLTRETRISSESRNSSNSSESSESSYPHVVITGGEPGLQLTKTLIDKLHNAGYFIQIETNGTIQLPEGIDWVTCSPKSADVENLKVFAQWQSGHAQTWQSGHVQTWHREQDTYQVDELKVVYTHPGMDLTPYLTMPAREYRLQPCDTGDPEKNQQILQCVIQTIKENPKWRLSLQTHKIISIP